MTTQRKIARVSPRAAVPADDDAPDSRVRERAAGKQRAEERAAIAVIDRDGDRRERLLSALRALGERAVGVADWEALLILDDRIECVVGELDVAQVGAMLHALASFAPSPALIARVDGDRDAAEGMLRRARVERVEIVDAALDAHAVAEIARRLSRP